MVFVDVPGRLGRGAVGSSNLAAAVLGAEKITYGTMGRARNLQGLGTKLAGSINAGTLIQRYAVWGQPFANASYLPLLQLSVNADAQGTRQMRSLRLAVLRRAAGSMVFGVHSADTGALRMPGTIFIYGFP